MTVQNPDFKIEYISLYKEARNLVFEYTIHEQDYRNRLLERLLKPTEVYKLYPLKTVVFFLLKLSPPEVAASAKPPFRPGDIHVFLMYFGRKGPYNELNSIAEGKFPPLTDQEQKEVLEFNKLPEEQKDKKLAQGVSKKLGGLAGFISVPFAPKSKAPLFIRPSVIQTIKRIPIPSFVKDAGVWTLIQAGNLINRHPKITTSFLSGVIGGLVTYASTGQPVLGWVGGLMSAGGMGMAQEYISAPRPEPEQNQQVSGGGGGGGGISFGPSNPMRGLGRGAGRNLGRAGTRAGARLAATGARAAAPLLLNPITWVVIGIIIFIFLFLFAFPGGLDKLASIFKPPELEAPPVTTAPKTQLVVSKTAPDKVPNGTQIPYQITVTYTGVGTADITVTDKIPDNTDFVSSNPAVAPDSSGVLTWNISKLQTNQSQIISLIVNPNKNDIYVQNKDYSATITGTTGGTTPGGGGTPPTGPLGDDYDTALRGRGRITNELGSSEDEFIPNIMANITKSGSGGYIATLLSKEDALRKVYRVSLAMNVNPLIVIGAWGNGSGFSTSGDVPFDCDVHLRRPQNMGFDNNLQCSVNTWDYWMGVFETTNQGGVLSIPTTNGRDCTYNDPLLYATEWFGPVCHTDDGNENFKKNVLSFYKTFLGQ